MSRPTSLEKAFCIACFLFGLVWVAYHQEFYFSKDFLLPRDNAKHHLPLFLYITRYLSLFSHFPTWFFGPYGGAWIAPQTNNFLLIAPYRWPGYLLAWGGVDGILAYKLSLILGSSLFLTGIFFLTQEIFHKLWLSAFTTLMALLTSVSLCFLFQEQSLGTLIFLPYLGVTALRSPHNPKYAFATAMLLGWMTNLHYPHLIVIFLAGVFLSLLLTYRSQLIAGLRIYWGSMGLRCVGIFLIASSPLFFSYFQYADEMESPLRAQSNSIAAMTFEEYDKINRFVPSSLNPANLRVYLNYSESPRVDITAVDDSVLHMTPAVFFLLFCLLFSQSLRSRFLLLAIFLTAISSIGIHGPLPYWLFHLIPGMSLFRQWYHFTALLDLLLLFCLPTVLKEMGEETISTRTLIIAGLVTLGLNFFGILPLFTVTLPTLLIAVQEMLFKRRRVTVFLLCGWIFLSTIPDTLSLFQVYRAESLNRNAYYPVHPYPTKFDQLTNTYWEPVIRVKGFRALDSAQPGHPILYGIEKNKTLHPLPPTAVSFSSKGIRFSPHSSYSHIVVNQMNDGEWLLNGSPLVTKGPALVFPLNEPSTLSRKTSLWSYLLWFMWCPIVFLIYPSKKESRFFPNLLPISGFRLKPLPK